MLVVEEYSYIFNGDKSGDELKVMGVDVENTFQGDQALDYVD